MAYAKQSTPTRVLHAQPYPLFLASLSFQMFLKSHCSPHVTKEETKIQRDQNFGHEMTSGCAEFQTQLSVMFQCHCVTIKTYKGSPISSSRKLMSLLCLSDLQSVYKLKSADSTVQNLTSIGDHEGCQNSLATFSFSNLSSIEKNNSRRLYNWF